MQSRTTSATLAGRLEILMAGLPEHKCVLTGEILERDDLFLGEVTVVVIHFEQDRLSGCAVGLHGGDEFPRLPRNNPRIIPPGDAEYCRILHSGLDVLDAIHLIKRQR